MGNNRILIAEDDVISGKYIRDALIARGYDAPDIVTSADELMRAVERFNPDIILMDVLLEGAGDGIDAAGKVAARHDIPVIYLTGHTDRDILDRAKTTGPYGFLVKPVNINELVITVEFALYRHGMGKMLKQSEERYRAIVETAPVMICRFHPEHFAITFVNDEFSRYFDVKQENVIGRPLDELLANTDLSNAGKIYAALSAENPVLNHELRIRINEEERWQRWIAQGLFDEQGKITEIQAIGEDITERKKSDEALRVSEEKFYKTFHSSPSGMLITRMDDDAIIDMNEKLLVMSGFTREELLGMPGNVIEQFIEADVLESLRTTLRRFGAVRDREVRLPSKSGEMMTMLVSVEVLDLGGEKYLLSVLNDITEVKKIEKALRQSEEKFHLLFEQSADAQLLMENSFIVDCNMAAVHLYGARSKSDILGMAMYDLSPEYLPEGMHTPTRMDEIISLVYQMGSLSLEWVSLRLDGREVPVDITLTAIPIAGKPMIHAVLKDITLRKMAQSALSRSEEKYRVLVQAMSDGLVQGDEQGIVVFVNDQFCLMIGCREEEIIGRPILDFIHEADRQGFEDVLSGKTSARPGAYEIALLITDGIKTGMVVSPRSLTDDQGRVTGFVAVFTDISERKYLERQILEISMREQQRIGRDLHDDLGQILAGTGFLCESLVKKLTVRNIPEAEDARGITALINEAKEHTRLLSRGLSPVEVDSGGIIAALDRLTRTMENVYSVSCKMKYDSSITINDSMVETQFHYIVQESITNAIRHGNAGRITVSLTNRRGIVRLEIEDDGTGFPDDVDSLKGMGLRTMQYRANAIGAAIKIGTNKHGGTTVSC